jgi:hypothetical protein
MTNFKKIFTSFICLTSLACFANAGDTQESASWSEWTHDGKVLPELYLRTRCVQDPASPKKAVWEIQFKDVGDALVEVKGKGWVYDIPARDEAGAAQVEAKSCSKLPEVKMDGGVPAKGYGYKITFKDGALTIKPHDKHHVDWGGWLTAGMMGMAAVSGTMAQNNAQMAEIRAQQQAQQQAAAAARAQQLAQLQAAQQAQMAAQQAAAAQRAAQAAQVQAQLAAQRAAADQRAVQSAQAAAQAARGRSSSNSGGYSGSGSRSGASTPQPQAGDLSISQNYVDNYCDNGTTVAHYQLTNESYSNAQMTVQFEYQTGGVISSFTTTRNLRPRSSNDYSQTIQCGGERQLSDFGGRSYIRQWQFF